VNENITQDDTQRRRQSDAETDNEKSEGDQDRQDEKIAITSDNIVHLQNHRWLQGAGPGI
jgi:hypothetical protein